MGASRYIRIEGEWNPVFFFEVLQPKTYTQEVLCGAQPPLPTHP